MLYFSNKFLKSIYSLIFAFIPALYVSATLIVFRADCWPKNVKIASYSEQLRISTNIFASSFITNATILCAPSATNNFPLSRYALIGSNLSSLKFCAISCTFAISVSLCQLGTCINVGLMSIYFFAAIPNEFFIAIFISFSSDFLSVLVCSWINFSVSFGFE